MTELKRTLDSKQSIETLVLKRTRGTHNHSLTQAIAVFRAPPFLQASASRGQGKAHLKYCKIGVQSNADLERHLLRFRHCQTVLESEWLLFQ